MRSSMHWLRRKRIELRNFGVFEVKKRAARKARNPRTGQRVDVPEKYVVTFKPGKEMEERVRQLEREAAEAAARARESACSSPRSPRRRWVGFPQQPRRPQRHLDRLRVLERIREETDRANVASRS